MKKIISLLLLFTFGLSSCEKDDICDANTPTTPRLVITFYDIASPTKTKNVTNLKVIGDEMEQGIVFNESLAEDDSLRYVTSGSTVSIPLKVNDSTSTFKFINNSLSTTAITVSYTHLTLPTNREV